MMQRVRLADVAREAQVTSAAASLALNGKPGVSKETREKIIAIARQMGYAPHPGAKALARGRTGQWGVFISGDEHIWSRWLSGMLAQTSGTGIRLVVSRLPSRERRQDMIRQVAAESRYDGCVLLDPDSDDTALRPFLDASVPTVIAGRRSHWFDCVELHDRQAVDQMLVHLSQNGKLPVSLIVTRQQMQRDDSRVNAWHTHLVRLRHEGHQITVADDSMEAGMSALQQLLAYPNAPRAIFCVAGDKTASGVLREAHARGISVPQELAVGGYGDAPFAAWTTPELSTIQIPWEDTGTRSAVTLTKRIATPGTSIVHRTMDARLVIRKSS